MPATFPTYKPRSIQEIVLQDLKEMQDEKGKIITDIVDILAEKNELLQDMRFRAANKGTDRYWTNVTTSFPKSWWMRYNRGIPASKATYASIEETCGVLGARSEIDARMAEEQDNGRAFRLMQDRAHIQQMSQDMTEYLFYGQKSITPEGFDGFMPRYNTLNTAEVTSKNVIDCGGTGNHLASIWLICWGDGVFGFHPNNIPAGITVKDYGAVPMQDPDGNTIFKYLTEFRWGMGLVITDWRCVVRLCNIDVDNLMSGIGIGDPDVQKAGNMNLLIRLQQAVGLINGVRSAGDRLGFYMNADVLNGLNILSARTNSNVVRVQQSFNDYGNSNDMGSFAGIPLRRVDRLKSTEDKVVA